MHTCSLVLLQDAAVAAALAALAADPEHCVVEVFLATYIVISDSSQGRDSDSSPQDPSTLWALLESLSSSEKMYSSSQAKRSNHGPFLVDRREP